MTVDVRVKLCGLTGAADAVAAAAAGADFLGFVLAKSRREVTARDVSLALAAVRREHPARAGDTAARPVLVMVDPTQEDAQRAMDESDVRHIQLSGEETPDFCDRLRARGDCTVWKAWGVRGDEKDRRAADYCGAVDAMLFDRHKGSARGGTGTPFDWRALDDVWPLLGRLPVVVAGGLTPDNVAGLLRRHSPYAVDVSSGIETDGRKDPDKMKRFVQRVRSFRLDPSNQEQGSVTDVSG